ncbi:hypothetical protein Tco_0846431 [Tanacetum coccineum]
MSNSNTNLQTQLKGEIEDFKTKNKSLESSNNHFKEANNSVEIQNQIYIDTKDLTVNSSTNVSKIHHTLSMTRNSSVAERSQQSTKNRGKAIVTSSAPTYDPEPATKIYKPTNNNLRTSSNTNIANQDNSPRINKGTGYDNQRAVNIARASENVDQDDQDGTDDLDQERDLLAS